MESVLYQRIKTLCEKRGISISKLESEILAVKKMKKCTNCGTELDIKAEFCSKCGKEQPKVEKVEIKTEPVQAENAEVVEVSDVEENNNQ